MGIFSGLVSVPAFSMTVTTSIPNANYGTLSIGPGNSGIVLPFPAGSGSGQYGFLWNASRSVTSGTPDQITLSGALVNSSGQTGLFVNVGMVAIYCPSGGGTLTLKPGSSNPVVWSQLPSAGISITAGTVAAWPMDLNVAMAVASGSADQIDVLASTGTIVYQIGIAGR